MPQFDVHLAHAMENGQNYVAVTFSMQIVQVYLLDDRNNSVVTDNDLFHTIEVLVRIATHSRQPPEGFVFDRSFLLFGVQHNLLELK
jgi:CCR4-NOT transcription complex subunit 1